MPIFNVVEARAEYATQPYRDLWSRLRVAEGRMTIDAPELKRAVEARENPFAAGFASIIRDAFRAERRQMYCFRCGHWRAIVLKIKAQKSDRDFIRNSIAGGTFVTVVIIFLYQVFR